MGTISGVFENVSKKVEEVAYYARDIQTIITAGKSVEEVVETFLL